MCIRDRNKLVAAKAPDARLLHLSGADSAGMVDGNVTRVVAYAQHALPLNAQARKVLNGPRPVVICLFSVLAAKRMTEALRFGTTAPLTAICLSDAVLGALEPGLLDEVVVAVLPTSASILDKMSEMFPL